MGDALQISTFRQKTPEIGCLARKLGRAFKIDD
jgi:hypothetical protein